MTSGLDVGIVAGASVPAIMSLFVLVARGQRPHENDGALVFPKNRAMRFVGFTCLTVLVWGLITSPPQPGDEIWAALVVFGLAIGTPVLCAGNVRLYSDRIEKRMLWMRTRITWSELDALVKDPRGECLVHGTQAQFKFNQYYVAYDKLITEIEQRAPKLRWMLETSPNHLPWERS